MRPQEAPKRPGEGTQKSSQDGSELPETAPKNPPGGSMRPPEGSQEESKKAPRGLQETFSKHHAELRQTEFGERAQERLQDG